MQVHIVNASNRFLYEEACRAMYRRRHEVFVAQKNWDLPLSPSAGPGEERDLYDDSLEVEYLMLLDARDRFVGAHRMLPATGPHLSTGPLAPYWEVAPPRGPRAWEISRSIFTPEKGWPDLARSMSILTVAQIEWALARGVERIFGVTDERYLGAMLETGWEVQPHGPAIPYPEGGRGIGLSWPVTAETLAVTRERRGVSGSVLATPRTDVVRVAS